MENDAQPQDTDTTDAQTYHKNLQKLKPGQMKSKKNEEEKLKCWKQSLAMRKHRCIKKLKSVALKLKNDQVLNPLETLFIIQDVKKNTYRYMGCGNMVKRFEKKESILEDAKPSKKSYADMEFITGVQTSLTPGKYPFPFTSGSGKSLAESQKETLDNIRVTADPSEEFSIRYKMELPVFACGLCKVEFHDYLQLLKHTAEHSEDPTKHKTMEMPDFGYYRPRDNGKRTDQVKDDKQTSHTLISNYVDTFLNKVSVCTLNGLSVFFQRFALNLRKSKSSLDDTLTKLFNPLQSNYKIFSEQLDSLVESYLSGLSEDLAFNAGKRLDLFFTEVVTHVQNNRFLISNIELSPLPKDDTSLKAVASKNVQPQLTVHTMNSASNEICADIIQIEEKADSVAKMVAVQNHILTDETSEKDKNVVIKSENLDLRIAKEQDKTCDPFMISQGDQIQSTMQHMMDMDSELQNIPVNYDQFKLKEESNNSQEAIDIGTSSELDVNSHKADFLANSGERQTVFEAFYNTNESKEQNCVNQKSGFSHCTDAFLPGSNTCLSKSPTAKYVAFCGICIAPFTSRNDLNSHISVHKSQLPRACCFCFKTISDLNKLCEHSLGHVVKSYYNCAACKLKFASENMLQTHKRTVLHLRNTTRTLKKSSSQIKTS